LNPGYIALNARAPIVALKDVNLADGSVMLFDGVDIALDSRVRACLVGRNGAGKSTLLKMLAGDILPDAGNRIVTPATRMVIVPQEPEITGSTLRDYCTQGGAMDYEADAALETFGLDPARGTTGLSGGEIRRVALARAFAEQPDVLLLDEPTNHLDIFAIQTLEEELAASRCAALIVSHDRAFLERVTQRCFWLENRKVRRLDKGFAAFDDWSDKVAEQEADEARRLDKQIQKENHWMLRGVTARRARNEGRRRKLVALRELRRENMRDQRGPMIMGVDAGGQSGQRVIEAKGVTKRWGERVIFENFSTRILRGDRIAVAGPNGAGKTTLVKLLLGQIASDAGSVKLGSNLEILYVDQARAGLKVTDTLWDVLAPDGGDQIMVRGSPRHIAAYAKDFLFRDSQLRQPVTSLSGGERNRLLLAKALATAANLMILDEPTNDLDMDTLDLLEDLLSDYEGTLILVSHDRDFIDRLATSTIALNGHGKIVETPGGWTDLLAQNPGFFDKAEIKIPVRSAPTPVAAPAPAKKLAKLTYKDQRRLEELEGLIAKLPGDIAALETQLEDPSLYSRDPKAFAKITANAEHLRKTLAASEEEWLELEEKREALG
jgi:ATP-binding cassette subfamily F protein uup